MNLSNYLLASSYPGAAPILFLFSGFSIILFAAAVVIIIANWKLYKKAGKEGWASIIPIHNMIVLLEIVKRPLWWIILMFIPLVNIVTMFIVCYDLAKAFGKDIG